MLASLDKQGFVSLYSMVDRQVLFMSNPIKQGEFYNGFLYHNKVFGQLLIIRTQKDKLFETLDIKLNKDQIASELNKNIQENINKRFLQESNVGK